MHFFKTLGLLALAALGSTAAVDTTNAVARGEHIKKRHCLCQSDVDKIIDAYVRILSKWNEADAKYIAEDFKDTSDSINSLAGIPLGTDIFPSKAAFVAKQNAQVFDPISTILMSVY